MSDYGLQDVGDIRYPKRRPWLILVILAVVAVVFFVKSRGDKAGDAHRDTPPVNQASTPQDDGSPAVSPVATPIEAGDHVKNLLRQARALEDRKSDDPAALAGARERLLAVLDEPIDERLRREVESRLGAMHVELVFTPLPFPGHKELYVVKRGDSIDRIAKLYKTTPQLVERGNMVSNPNLIKMGDTFKVFTGTFTVEAAQRSGGLSGRKVLQTVRGRDRQVWQDAVRRV